MTRRATLALSLVVFLSLWQSAFARGVSPYLPLNLDPDVENAIERVMILGDEPVMSRPIPAALVLQALPKACKVDRPLCERVRHYLHRYMHGTGVEFASISAAVTTGHSNITLPNLHGTKAQSPYQIAGAAYIQFSPYVLLNLGGEAHQGRATPTGTYLSLGFDWAQLDIGWRDHWWSPMTDSSMLISTEAPTMPSITLSNYQPLTRLRLHYSVFLARMSESSRIELPLSVNTPHRFTRGYPKMGGVRVGIEPVSGWALSLQRVLFWGGGAAGGESVSNILQAFINPAKAQSTGFNTGSHVVAKQEASITSRFIFPGRYPFSVYFEYAGNDTVMGQNYLLGKPALSAGIDFPLIGPFDFTFEYSSWAPTWYVHPATPVQTGYLDGLTNYGASIGSWFGDQRVLATATTLADQVGGQSDMLRIGWTPSFGGYMQLKLRALTNEDLTRFATFPYRNEYLGSLSYSYPWHGYAVGVALQAGRDVFGHHYMRVEGYLRDGEALLSHFDPTAAFAGKTPKGDHWFIKTGVNYYRLLVYRTGYARHYTPWAGGPHFTIGARRRISAHQDIGVALDVDSLRGRPMLGVRMVDYRYRFGRHLAAHAFVGAARYALATPAYGVYVGAGLEWRNLLPGWGIGVGFHNLISAQRLRDLRTEVRGGQVLWSTYSWTFDVSRSF